MCCLAGVFLALPASAAAFGVAPDATEQVPPLWAKTAGLMS